MKKLEELSFPTDRNYTSEHVWIKNDGASYLVGISDYAQDQLSEVAYVELPEVGSHFAANEQFGTVESVKSVNALYMPVSGTIEACNTELEETPTLINVGCYTNGWLVRIRPDNPHDLSNLPDANAYKALLG
ncbi:MAG: glycine cleavage system protein GcvH [Desulfovibrio sp.]|nr:glycine cleavage system protein GcvH [Desulfovibrio sp.]